MKRVWAALGFAATMVLSGAASAQAPKEIHVHQDAEIEELVNDYARPLLAAAGTPVRKVRVHIVEHEAVGLFLIDKENLFITFGTFSSTRTANELVGLLAHEIGHFTSGHFATVRSRIRSERAKDRTARAAGMVVGAEQGIYEILLEEKLKRRPGKAIEEKELSELLKRALLSELRAMEREADQKAATLLAATGEPLTGFIKFVEGLAQQEFLSASYQDPYVKLHPVAADRIRALKALPESLLWTGISGQAGIAERHDLVRAKVSAWSDSARIVLNRYPESDNSAPGRYARGIAYLRGGDTKKGLDLLASLQREYPGNKHFAAAGKRFAKR
jgi:predicted Zn-dependent protease